MPADKTSPKAIEALEKAARALKLRRSGLAYDEIAAQTGYNSAQAAHKAVTTALKRTLRDAADDLRDLQNSRIDEAIFAIWGKVQSGNLLAHRQLVRWLDRQAKLNGLDMPTKLQHSGQLDVTTLTDEQLDALIAGKGVS